MSNKISLDIEANTSNAEKAIVDLTRDVDKLQRKAAQTNFGKGGYGTRSAPQQQVNNVKTAKSLDISDLKNSFSNLGDQISALAGGLGEATNQINSFADTLVKLAIAYKALGVKSPIPVPSSQRYRVASEWRRGYQNADHFNNAKYNALKAAADRETDPAAKQRLLSQASLYRLSGGHTSKRTDELRAAEKTQRRLQTVERSVGPANLNGYKLTPSQRFNRGYLQFTNKGAALAERAKIPFALQGGRLAGMGNMIRGGLGMTPELIGRGGAWVAGGGVGRLAGAALSNPYVLAGTAAAAVATAPYLYSASQVSKGRGKAEELTDLETHFKQLSKNISGVEVDTLTKDLQRLGIDGAVPVEQLSRGASMLMLAFKGNQQETSKWTRILADMSAGTGQSVEYFAELITKANQFGTVEFEVFNQLNEKGIPIIEQLKGKFGDTREEIMKAAQAGKITAQEFMDAFEAAHKLSMEGANMRKAEVSRMDVIRQREQYEELEASNVTRAYDEALMDYEKSRRDRAKRRSEDEFVIAQSEALGDALGDLVQVFKTAGDGLSDAFTWTMEAIGAWNIDEHVAKTLSGMDEQTKAANRKLEVEGDELSSTAINTLIAQQQAIVDRATRISKEEEFDEEQRQLAKETAARAETFIAHAEDVLEKALEREEDESLAAAKAERERKHKEDQRKTSEKWKEQRADSATTEKELIEIAGVRDFAALEAAMDLYKNALDEGTAVESDLEKYNFYRDIKKEILDIRKELQRQADDAEKEAKKAREMEIKRDNYLAKREAEANPENYEVVYDSKYQQRASEMANLGFTRDDIDKYLSEDRARDIVKVEKKLAENTEKLKKEEQNYADSKKTGQEAVLNAWGSATRTMTSFTSPYEQNSLKELRAINVKLQKEIDALNRLDTTPRAI